MSNRLQMHLDQIFMCDFTPTPSPLKSNWDKPYPTLAPCSYWVDIAWKHTIDPSQVIARRVALPVSVIYPANTSMEDDIVTWTVSSNVAMDGYPFLSYINDSGNQVPPWNFSTLYPLEVGEKPHIPYKEFGHNKFEQFPIVDINETDTIPSIWKPHSKDICYAINTSGMSYITASTDPGGFNGWFGDYLLAAVAVRDAGVAAGVSNPFEESGPWVWHYLTNETTGKDILGWLNSTTNPSGVIAPHRIKHAQFSFIIKNLPYPNPYLYLNTNIPINIVEDIGCTTINPSNPGPIQPPIPPDLRRYFLNHIDTIIHYDIIDTDTSAQFWSLFT